MNDTLQKILAFCEERVAAGDIYVWGGSGQKSSAITEAWIRQKESKNQNGAHVDQAVQTFMARVAAGKRAFRAYDCSGYISAALQTAGVLDKRRDCDGLYALCGDLESPIDGALLFRVNSEDPNDETHVGIYFNGYQYHAKGREDGVKKEPYKASYWAKIAWFNALDASAEPVTEVPAPVEDYSGEADQLDPPYVQITDSVNVRRTPGLSGKIIFVAHEGDQLPCTGKDPKTGWFSVECPKGFGYVSCDIPQYAKLVEV
jgi:uncharacterized protein YgiM (DUF1202 family)